MQPVLLQALQQAAELHPPAPLPLLSGSSHSAAQWPTAITDSTLVLHRWRRRSRIEPGLGCTLLSWQGGQASEMQLPGEGTLVRAAACKGRLRVGAESGLHLREGDEAMAQAAMQARLLADWPQQGCDSLRVRLIWGPGLACTAASELLAAFRPLQERGCINRGLPCAAS